MKPSSGFATLATRSKKNSRKYCVSAPCRVCVCALACVYFPSGGEATLRLAGKALNAVCHSHIESYKA